VFGIDAHSLLLCVLQLGDLNAMKVVDLRAELKKRGLSGAGVKADLVARLQESLDA
jgi:hypothetical protein